MYVWHAKGMPGQLGNLTNAARHTPELAFQFLKSSNRAVESLKLSFCHIGMTLQNQLHVTALNSANASMYLYVYRHLQAL